MICIFNLRMSIQKFILILVLLVAVAIPQLGHAQSVCAALFRTSQSETIRISPQELAHQVSEKIASVTEFQYIQSVAEQVGVRIWLFGGTASGFIHYVKWATMREKGDLRFQGDRFDFDFTNIYRSTQDLDIVVDGTIQQIETVQNMLVQKYPQFLASTAAWEVRSLREAKGKPGEAGYKEALLNDFDFLNQNSDSNSTGLVEISKTREPIVRDLRDWENANSQFLTDSAREEITFYKSDFHNKTSRYLSGQNPEIFSVIRFLTKAFQYELHIKEEDFKKINLIIRRFEATDLKDINAKRRLIDIGKKLFKHAVNIEYAWNTIEQLGLRKKLLKFDSVETFDSLAFWMNREPLRTKPLGTGLGKTARDLNISIVAHESLNFLAYESITRSHTGQPNALISRTGAPNEAAAFGDGFYTRVGTEGARGTGITIRFHLHPEAREGTDFLKVFENYLVILNKRALKVIPESIHMGLLDLAHFILNDKSFANSDRALVEKMKRRLSIAQVSAEELSETVNFILKLDEKGRKKIKENKLIWPILMKQSNFFRSLTDLQITDFYKQYGGNDLFMAGLITSQEILNRVQSSKVLQKAISVQMLALESWAYFQKNNSHLDRNLKVLSDRGLSNLLEILQYFKEDKAEDIKLVREEVYNRLEKSQILQSWIVQNTRSANQDLAATIVGSPELLKKLSNRSLVQLTFKMVTSQSTAELILRTQNEPSFQNYMIESIVANKVGYQAAVTYLREVIRDYISDQNMIKLLLSGKYAPFTALSAGLRYETQGNFKKIADSDIKKFIATASLVPKSDGLVVINTLVQHSVFRNFITPTALKSSASWANFKERFASTVNILRQSVGHHRGAEEALGEFLSRAIAKLNEAPAKSFNDEIKFIYPVLIKDPVSASKISMRAIIQHANINENMTASLPVVALRSSEELIKGIEEFFDKDQYEIQFGRYKGALDFLKLIPRAQEYLTDDRKLNYIVRRWGDYDFFDTQAKDYELYVDFTKINYEQHLEHFIKIFKNSNYVIKDRSNRFSSDRHFIKSYLDQAPPNIKLKFADAFLAKLKLDENISFDLKSVTAEQIQNGIFAVLSDRLKQIVLDPSISKAKKIEFFERYEKTWNSEVAIWRKIWASVSINVAILKVARTMKGSTPEHLVEDAVKFDIDEISGLELLSLIKQRWYLVRSMSVPERILRAHLIVKKMHKQLLFTDSKFYRITEENIEQAKALKQLNVMSPKTYEMIKDQIFEVNIDLEALRNLGIK